MLCDVCRNIFTGSVRNSQFDILPGRIRWRNWRPHQESMENIRTSAQAGCLICAKLWRSHSYNHPTRENNANSDEQIVDAAKGFSSSYMLRLGKVDVPHVQVRLDFGDERIFTFNLHETNKLSHELSGPTVISHSTNSVASLELAKRWLQTCLDNHDHCNHDADKYWRPTRLIELDQPSTGNVVLNCTSHEAYVTLSHCWGRGDPLKLTSSTLSALLEGVPISKLPQTFQDAIVVARYLGVRFIWIDSLCILQDSQEDWAYESSLMGKVYSQALCNIGATASSTGEEGCFRQRDPLLLDRTIIESSWTDYWNAKLHIYPGEPEQVDEKISPLLRRGWVVQEHVLSRRFLHFHAQQVIFECRQGCASEMYPEGAPQEMPLLTDPLRKAGEPRSLIYHDLKSRDADLYSFWGRLVEYYSKCRLTIEADKLIAISGIAKLVEGGLGDSYYAGMWGGQFPRCLLWTVVSKDVEEDTPLSASYVAPTWSWASTKAAVSFPKTSISPDIRVRTLAEVVQTEVGILSPDPTGKLVSGFIKLRGRLRTLVLHSTLDKQYSISMKPMDSERTNSLYQTRVHMDKAVEPDRDSDRDRFGRYGIRVHFMPIESETGDKNIVSWNVKGLLLAPTGGDLGTFYRVGVLSLGPRPYTPYDKEPKLDDFLAAENHYWLRYERFEGVNKYTITVM